MLTTTWLLLTTMWLMQNRTKTTIKILKRKLVTLYEKNHTQKERKQLANKIKYY